MIAKTIDSTVREFPAVAAALTVKDVIVKLIEQNVSSWRILPLSMRNALMERPADFQFRQSDSMIPIIYYKGISLEYDTIIGNWVIKDIE